MKELITWLYGKSSKNAHIRQMAEKLILLLHQKGSMEYKLLCSELGIGFDKYKKPKRTFYFVVNPLKKIQLVKEKRVFTEADRKSYQTVYFLDPKAFQGYMTRIIEEILEELS